MENLSGIRTLFLDGASLSHDTVARVFGFPEWYGRNLDALYDCLTALTVPTAVTVTDPAAKPGNARLMKVFHDAAAVNPRLWVFVR